MRVSAIAASILISTAALAAEVPPSVGPPSVTVQGESQVDAAPDQAIIELGVESRAESAADAQNRVNRVSAAILSALQTMGVDEQDVQTSALSLIPLAGSQAAGRASNPAEIIGYRALDSVRIRLRDLSRVGPVIDAGLRAGANRVQGVTFDLVDARGARTQALKQAVADAAAKAAAIAQALGLRLGPVREVREGNVGIRPVMMQQAMMRAESAASTAVSPGQVTVSASVTLTYGLSE